MRILFNSFDIEIEVIPDHPVCICIENPFIYREILSSLWRQNSGETGGIVFSDGGKEFPMQKKAECIINPFGVDINDKRLLNRLYQDIVSIAIDDLHDTTNDINTRIVNYLDSIIEHIHYPIEYETSLDIAALAKIYKVKFDDSAPDVVSKLVSFCFLLHRVSGKELFVFTNLKHFMDPDELSEFYKSMMYEHLCILDIEGLYSYKSAEETCIIVDKDKCRIDLV